jgi:hypothetical protein
MYEIAKLKGQFKDILLENGLLSTREDDDDENESGGGPRDGVRTRSGRKGGTSARSTYNSHGAMVVWFSHSAIDAGM